MTILLLSSCDEIHGAGWMAINHQLLLCPHTSRRRRGIWRSRHHAGELLMGEEVEADHGAGWTRTRETGMCHRAGSMAGPKTLAPPLEMETRNEWEKNTTTKCNYQITNANTWAGILKLVNFPNYPVGHIILHENLYSKISSDRTIVANERPMPTWCTPAKWRHEMNEKRISLAASFRSNRIPS
jgi:hypothetical protein